jgi:Ser/Thr protein kinase RdoA (MazF antagonist)
MQETLLNTIASSYGFDKVIASPAPRQLIAETYLLQVNDEQKLFCKLLNKPIWIAKILNSLPVLDEMRRHGFERANYPIKTASGGLSITVADTLIVLFNYIQGQQTENYDQTAFGRLVGEVHALTPHIHVTIPQQDIVARHHHFYEKQFISILEGTHADPVLVALQAVLRQHEAEIKKHYRTLEKLTLQFRASTHAAVITHGDAGGNIIATSPTDLYLIDWDEILLAPPERDLWYYDSSPDFVAGYKSVFPTYQTDTIARNFCKVSQYFDYLAYYFAEIVTDFPADYRRKKVQELDEYFTSWIKPHMDQLDG